MVKTTCKQRYKERKTIKNGTRVETEFGENEGEKSGERRRKEVRWI